MSSVKTISELMLSFGSMSNKKNTENMLLRLLLVFNAVRRAAGTFPV